MKGYVDSERRALLTVEVKSPSADSWLEIELWIDTAFNGSRVVPQRIVQQLGLDVGSTADAILANGRVVQLETYTCCVRWFGLVLETQVVANESTYGLLGTMLLDGTRLEIDYALGDVSLDSAH